MRLLHTSDWHLGRTLHGVDLHEAQRQMVDQVVDAARAHRVDGVLIAGDVFDRAVPPVPAVQLWSHALRELASCAPVVVTSGNHDSAVRLGAGSGLFRDGVHVVTDTSAVGTPVTWFDETGPVLVYPIPFLDPDAARHSLSDGAEPLPRSHEAVMGEAMRRVRADLAGRPGNPRSVVVAHAFCVSGPASTAERSDSERDLRIGGVDSVASTVFDGIDYVALGHLHGAQQVGEPRVRYCGSPLRYSFSEARQVKQLAIIELAADGSVTVEPLALAQPRGMATLTAEFDELLTADAYEAHVDDWLQVTVTDAARPPAMVTRVRERFPHALVVRHLPVTGPLAATSVERVPVSPREVAESFVSYVTGDDITAAELAVFDSAYELARDESRSA
jgi:exonuclease SbcD